MNILVNILFLLFLSVTQAYNSACLENYHVFDHACVECPYGSANAAGDPSSGDNTDCRKKMLCLHDNDNPNDFNKQMGPIQNALIGDYELFYPNASENMWYGPAAENKWYGPTEVPLNYTNLQRTFLPRAPLCYEGVNNVACQCANCRRIEIYMLDPGEVCRNGTIFSKSEYDTTIVNVTDYINTNGPFDTVLGFSQGAAMALAYMADTNPFQKAVLLEGYVPDTLKSHILAGAPFRDIHVLLYFAQQSHFYSPSPTSNFTSMPLDLWEMAPTVIDVDAVHGVPQNASVINQITDFLNSEPGDCIQYYANDKCEIMNCPCGYYESNGTCSKCSPGHFCNNIRDIQEPCPSGKYQSRWRQTTCFNTSKGHYAAVPGQKAQTACTVGKFQDGVGATECKNCVAGQYQSQPGTTTCDNCDVGQYQSQPGTTACVDCAVGKFQDGVGAAECKNCARGKFQGQPGTTTCDNCDSGKYNDEDGQSNESIACHNCAVGKFQDGVGAAECKNCAAGKFQGQPGTSTCDNCDSGKYARSTGHTYCHGCPVGWYSNSGQSWCNICKRGKKSIATSCEDCAAGKYQNKDMQTTCQECYSGRVSNSAAIKCTSCAFGKHANTANTDCLDCTAGKYFHVVARQYCTNASKGHYVAGQASLKQYACPTGFFQEGVGAVECKSCVAGKFQDDQGNTTCDNCAAGHFSYSGWSTCSICPQGKKVNNVQTNCSECAAGQYQNVKGQDECISCPTQKSKYGTIQQYQDETGQTECFPCLGEVSSDLKKCTPTCAYSLNPHICPTTSIREDIKYIDNYDTKSCSENGACTNDDCCAKLSETRIPTAKTKHEDKIRNKRNALKLDRVIKNTDSHDIETRWNDVNEQASTNIISTMPELFMQTVGEIIAQKAAIKKRSRVEQMAEKQKKVVDTLSTLNIAAAKADAKAAEAAAVAINDNVAEEAARLSIKQVSITVRNVKKALRDQMEEVKQSLSDASNVALTEDEVSIFIPSADAGIMNDAIDSKMKKIGIEYIRLKLAKNHSNVDFNNMANFDCTGADMNLDEMGIYDFEEVFIEENETAVACNLGVPVTYIYVATSNVNDYNQYEVYCCGYSSGARLRRQLSSVLSCQQIYKDVDNHGVQWNEHDTYKCPATQDYLHPVMSLGGTFTGCILEANGTVGWVYDNPSPSRTMDDCGGSQCTVNNTNVMCLYFNESCQPSCVVGYGTNGANLTCSGGDQYSSETTCTGCSQNTYSAGGTMECETCPAGSGAVALSGTCHHCPVGEYVSSTTGCEACPTGKYVARTGQLGCHDVTDIATDFLDATEVRCSFGGTAQYDNNGAYKEGCKQDNNATDVKIVMYGVVKVKDDTGACETRCAKWYGNLKNGFTDPRDGYSNVATYDASNTYCQYLLWTSIPIKSNMC